MAKSFLIGSEKEGTSGETAVEKKIIAYQFPCEESGTLEAITFKTGTTSNTTTSVVFGIYANAAETKPGAVLGKATYPSKPGTNALIEVTGLSVKLELGILYWLAFVPVNGTLHYKAQTAAAGALPDRLATTQTYETIEEATWEAVHHAGPILFQGLGLATGGIKVPPFVPPTFHTPKGLHKPFYSGAYELPPSVGEGELLPMLV